MDDVFVVVGLLLFGSLLFCLCCYKVSNLLYMLYHIDDAEVDADSSAVGVIGADPADFGKDYNFVSRYAAATAAAASGNMPELSEMGKINDTEALLMSEMTSDEKPLVGNHIIPNHVGPNHPRGLKSATSVTSLSIGIQCNPDDVEGLGAPMTTTNSETCLIQPMQNHHRSNRVHVSDPDFRLNFDSIPVAYHHRSNLHHRHHHQPQHHMYQQELSASEHTNPYSSGSLGRNGQKRESWQQPYAHYPNHSSHRFSPTAVVTRLSNVQRQGVQAQSGPNPGRRYGSIRVAECSFIEQHDDASSPPSVCDSDQRRPPPEGFGGPSSEILSGSSISRRRSSSSSLSYRQPNKFHNHHHQTTVPSAFNPYSFDSGSHATGDPEAAKPDASSRLNPPPTQGPTTPQTHGRRGSELGKSQLSGVPPRRRSQGGAGANSGYGSVMCNGPRFLPMSESKSQQQQQHHQGREGHIIPPPLSFEDFKRNTNSASSSKPRW